MKYTKQQKKCRFLSTDRRQTTDDRQNKIFGKKFLEGKIRKNVKNLRLLKKGKKARGRRWSILQFSLVWSGQILGGDCRLRRGLRNPKDNGPGVLILSFFCFFCGYTGFIFCSILSHFFVFVDFQNCCHIGHLFFFFLTCILAFVT